MYRTPKYSYVVPGDWNVICQRDGFQYKAQLDNIQNDGQQPGLKVCPKCYDKRHPQDFVQAKPDGQAAPWTRPQPTDDFRVGVLESVYDGNRTKDTNEINNSNFPNPTVVTLVTKA